MNKLRRYIKQQSNPFTRFIYRTVIGYRYFYLPLPIFIAKILLKIHQTTSNSLRTILQKLYWTPLFTASVQNPIPKKLYLYDGMPNICGALNISIGEQSRISGQTTFNGRTCSDKTPQLIIGSNVDITGQTSISVGTIVKIDDNVRFAGKCTIAGYPGHPIAPKRRALGEPDDDSQIGDVVIGQDAWIGSNVFINRNVTIGHGSIITANSVVSSDIPPLVIASGNPARPIVSIDKKTNTSISNINPKAIVLAQSLVRSSLQLETDPLPEHCYKDIAKWTASSQLRIINKVESILSRALSDEEALQLSSIKNVANILQEHFYENDSK